MQSTQTSTTTRSLYQPQLPQTVWGVLALPQRGQMLRGGVCSFHALARRLRVFDFDVFFLGTAIVRSFATASTTLVDRDHVHAVQF